MKYLFFLFILFSEFAFAQNNYFVYLKDKNNNGFSLADASKFLSQKAINRRQKQKLSITTQDLPLTETYINQLRQTGAKILGKSRWFNAVLVNCDEATYSKINSLSFVKTARLVGKAQESQANDNDKPRQKIVSTLPNARQEAENYGVSLAQVSQIGIDKMHEKGFKGKNMLIAVLDDGFFNVDINPAFKHLKIVDTYDFTTNTKEVYSKGSQSLHGAKVLSVLAAYSPNNVIGGAFEADYVLYKTEIDALEQPSEEVFWIFAAERADSIGVDIISTSLGYNTFDNSKLDYKKTDLDGNTAIITKAADFAASKGIIVVKSVGNEGNKSWQTLTFPADADSILAVGSVNSSGKYSVFSSRGFTADRRVKPDAVVMGEQVATISPAGFVNFESGTSFATPLLAGMVAGLWQANPSLTNLQIIDLVRRAGSRFRNPSDSIGYGIPTFDRANFLVTGTENLLEKMMRVRYFSPQSLLFIEANNIYNDVIEVQIFDILGRSMLKNSYTSATISISLDLPLFKSGLYVVTIQNRTEKISVKIVKD